jgi:uncharacterized protein
MVDERKRERLRGILRECGSVVIGYSGGVDSVFLATVAVQVLGPANVLAVTGKSDSIANWMEDTARGVDDPIRVRRPFPARRLVCRIACGGRCGID